MEISRSTRSIQREDVWAAADALLLDGKRPTIERVRQKIGRGSPNTVSPMLEEWFATLGPRMAQLKSGHAGSTLAEGSAEEGGGLAIPQPVLQSVQTLWSQAMQQATDVAQARLQSERDVLMQAQRALEDEQSALQQERAVMAQQRASLEQALAVAHAQVKMQGARVVELEQATRQKDQLAHQQQQRLQAMEQELFASRKARDEADKIHAAQLSDLQATMQAQQHRALQEVDRARQESKQWMAAHRTEQEKLAQLEHGWQTERESQQQLLASKALQLTQAQDEARTLEAAMQRASEQDAHQRALLVQQHQMQIQQLQSQLEKLQGELREGRAAGGGHEAPHLQRQPSLARTARSITAAQRGLRQPGQIRRGLGKR